jgi:hypothetical protein
MKKRKEKEVSELMLDLERKHKLFLERLSPEERALERERKLAWERLSDEEVGRLTFEYKLKLARLSFERSNNPYYAWYAIDVCIKDKKPLPNWLMPYLAQCSERMLSSAARQTRDLRKLLPWVLGFPPKKSGPGNVLAPDRAHKKMLFAFEFAVQIMEGNDPVTARRKASDVLDGKDANVDDKTLMRWLLEEFNLKKAPANAEQWENAIRQQEALFLPFMFDQLYRRLHFQFRTKSRETLP